MQTTLSSREVASSAELLHRAHLGPVEVLRKAPAPPRPWFDPGHVSKSLERIADHAENVAKEVVYLCEAQDIRHTGKLPGTTTPG